MVAVMSFTTIFLLALIQLIITNPLVLVILNTTNNTITAILLMLSLLLLALLQNVITAHAIAATASTSANTIINN